MMNSYQRSERKNVRLAAITAIIFGLFVIDALSGGALRSAARVSAASLWGIGGGIVSAISGSGFFSGRIKLARENELLKLQLAELQIRAALYGSLSEENSSLKSILNLRDNSGIAAPIASSLRASPYGTFMIGVGSEEGIANGDLVVIGLGGSEGFVVGVVSDAGAGVSIVKKIFAPGTSIEADVGGSAITLIGHGDQARSRVPRSFSVAVGDIVTSARFRARGIGVVGEIREDPSAVYKDIFVRAPVNPSAVKFVYVVPH